jgi:hypothetical protein
MPIIVTAAAPCVASGDVLLLYVLLTFCEAAACMARRVWELTVGRWDLHGEGLAFRIKHHLRKKNRKRRWSADGSPSARR